MVPQFRFNTHVFGWFQTVKNYCLASLMKQESPPWCFRMVYAENGIIAPYHRTDSGDY